MITFPASPTNNQTFTADDTVIYQYNTTRNLWVRTSGNIGLAGATGLTGATGLSSTTQAYLANLFYN